MVKVIKTLLVVGTLGFGLCSCSDHDHEHVDEKAVKWNQLRELDELSEFGEAYSQKKDMGSLKKLAPKLVIACDELLKSGIPENAKDKTAVKELLKDVHGLRDLMKTVATMSDAQLASAVESFHPLVVKLMEEAGLPQVHANCEHHEEHDHDDHDHKE